jgi:hypothetical protein
VRESKPIWTSATFLVYTGGLTVLLGGLFALEFLSRHYGSGGIAGWALLVLLVLYGIAHAFRLQGRRIAAGIFAFAAVIAWGLFVAYLFKWWGWLGPNESFKHWSWARLALELLILAAAVDDERRFGFPFIRLIFAVVAWFFVIDLITSGGNFTAVVTLFVGLMYLGVGFGLRAPSSFWFHLVGGLLIGGTVLYWWHTTDAQWAIVSIVAFLYVALAYATRRSSWAVLGTIGFFLATIHYVVGSPTALAQGAFGLGGSESCTATASGTICTSSPASVSAWSPALAFGLLGFWLVLLGVLGRRRTAATLASPAE